jgi:hypothetical protein
VPSSMNRRKPYLNLHSNRMEIHLMDPDLPDL